MTDRKHSLSPVESENKRSRLSTPPTSASASSFPRLFGGSQVFRPNIPVAPRSVSSSPITPSPANTIRLNSGDWFKTRLIGIGSYGKVWEITKVGDPTQKLAMKQFDSRTEFIREAKTAELIANGWTGGPDGPVPYFTTVAEMVPSIADAKKGYRGPLMICYKKAWGSLDNWRRSHTPTIDQMTTMYDNLTNGLLTMHELGYAHRDIKPENVLVYEDPNAIGGWTFVFGDLGSVCGRNSGYEDCSGDGEDGENRTTYAYIPWQSKPNSLPNGTEIANEGMYDSFDQVRWVDLYSLGCTIHFMITGKNQCLLDWSTWLAHCQASNLCDRHRIDVEGSNYPAELEEVQKAMSFILNTTFEDFRDMSY